MLLFLLSSFLSLLLFWWTAILAEEDFSVLVTISSLVSFIYCWKHCISRPKCRDLSCKMQLHASCYVHTAYHKDLQLDGTIGIRWDKRARYDVKKDKILFSRIVVNIYLNSPCKLILENFKQFTQASSWLLTVFSFCGFRRCLMSILADFYTSEIVQDPKYKFSQSGTYYAPPKSSYDQYVEFIKVNSSTIVLRIN